VKLRDFGLLTDENLDPGVIAYLRTEGFDVWDVCENGVRGATDVDLLRRAVADNRVIVTHDADFGTLAILRGEPVIGILFLRPGHIDPQFTIEMLRAVLTADPDVTPPFVLVAKRTGHKVTIRNRQLGP
jgi:predicted nuclease of predicted toxin-antitoxin system